MAHLRSFALICAHLHSFARICVFLHLTAFRTTAFGNCRFSSQTFRAPPGYPGGNPRISRPKVWFPWVSKGIPNFLAPTPSRGRPPPHRKISGSRSVGLCSFFFLEYKQGSEPQQEIKDKSPELLCLAVLDFLAWSFYRCFQGIHCLFLGVLPAFPQLFVVQYQDVGKGGLSLSGVAFMTVLAALTVLAVLASTLPSFCLSTKYSINGQPWRFWRFWRFRSWRLPPWTQTPFSDILTVWDRNKTWQPETWQDSAPFSPPGNRAIFSTCWGEIATKLQRKPGETGRKSPLEKIQKSSGDGAPKLQISLPCRGRARPEQ